VNKHFIKLAPNILVFNWKINMVKKMNEDGMRFSWSNPRPSGAMIVVLVRWFWEGLGTTTLQLSTTTTFARLR
jgi:hypothetical protein